jgi:DNA-binding MarR family transcriptional regulator
VIEKNNDSLIKKNKILNNSFLDNYYLVSYSKLMKKIKESPSPLKSHLGFWLRTVSNQVSQSFARKVEASGVTVAEWVILRELFENEHEVAPSLVAKNTQLSRGAVSKLIDRLVLKKLVYRKGSAEDRRYQTVTLTKAAESLVPKLAKLADENDEEFFGELSKTEKQNLQYILQKIVDTNGISEIPTE